MLKLVLIENRDTWVWSYEDETEFASQGSSEYRFILYAKALKERNTNQTRLPYGDQHYTGAEDSTIDALDSTGAPVAADMK